ncbi:MAG: AAA family ATPase, partial [Polyangiaceae bacterium]|nr:AAA family ATPase [Polyangiaceae bacterium]
MLTRLKVSGFKNLVGTEIRFGPFTCIAGNNAVGKSNIFDAIHFLALLADHTFVDAARKVRGGGDPASLFTAWGDGRMRFECDVV